MKIDEWIGALNELCAQDSTVIRELSEARLICNEDIAGHPTAQISCVDGKFRIGMIGILNALFSKEHPKHVLVLCLDDEPPKVWFKSSLAEEYINVS